MQTLLTVLQRSLRSFGSDKCSTHAAAIAYYTVFALFPMALVGVSLLGFFVGDASARERVAIGLADVIALEDTGRAALEETLQGVSQSRGLLGIAGLLVSLWSASGLFGAMRSALDSVWDVDRPLPMMRGKLRDLLLFFGFGGLLAASTASTGILVTAQAAGGAAFGTLSELAGPVFLLLRFVAPLILTLGAFLFLFRFAPHARLGWQDVISAAVISTLFFEFGKNILSYYIRNLGNFNALAGSLGAAILFLAFVYYAAQVILLSAEISKHLLLVKSGVTPVEDGSKAQHDSLQTRLQDAAVSLWRSEAGHHDESLPYAPARQDPEAHQPTDSAAEVEFKEHRGEGPSKQGSNRDAERPAA